MFRSGFGCQIPLLTELGENVQEPRFYKHAAPDGAIAPQPEREILGPSSLAGGTTGPICGHRRIASLRSPTSELPHESRVLFQPAFRCGIVRTRPLNLAPEAVGMVHLPQVHQL